MAAYIKRGQDGLWQQMLALLATDADSKVRATFGSLLILERKRQKPIFEQRYVELMEKIQHPLQLA